MLFKIFCFLLDYYNKKAPSCPACDSRLIFLQANSRFIEQPIYACLICHDNLLTQKGQIWKGGRRKC